MSRSEQEHCQLARKWRSGCCTCPWTALQWMPPEVMMSSLRRGVSFRGRHEHCLWLHLRQVALSATAWFIHPRLVLPLCQGSLGWQSSPGQFWTVVDTVLGFRWFSGASARPLCVTSHISGLTALLPPLGRWRNRHALGICFRPQLCLVSWV